MRTALYARVSTQDQHSSIQLHRLREYAKLRGLEPCGEFVDHGVSGRKDRRPALDDMMQAARKRQVDAVVVVKLDRLARSVRHLTELAAEFEALGVALIVIDQGIDTSTPSGRLLFHVLGSIAEFELGLIRERTLAGIEAARRRGKKLGRPRAVRDRHVSDRMKRLHANGTSVRKIAAMMDVSRSTVHRILHAAG